MSTPAYRVQIELSSLTYRGDRDERLVDFVVSGQADSPMEAFVAAFKDLDALGVDLDSIFANVTAPEAAS